MTTSGARRLALIASAAACLAAAACGGTAVPAAVPTAIVEPTAAVAAVRSPLAPPATAPVLDRTVAAPAPTVSIAATGAVAGPQPKGLYGIVWQWLESAYNDDSTLVVDDPAKYTVEFLPDGTLRATADCNSVGGRVSIKGSGLTITDTVTTLAACPEGSLEGPFLQDLTAAATSVLDGDVLVINMKMDVGDMRFRAAR